MLVTVGMGENGVFDVLFLLEKCVTPNMARRVLPIAEPVRVEVMLVVLWTRAIVTIVSEG